MHYYLCSVIDSKSFTKNYSSHCLKKKNKKKKNSEPMQTPENAVSLQDAVTCMKKYKKLI